MQTHRASQSRFPAQRAFVVQVAVAEPGVPDVPLGHDKATNLISEASRWPALAAACRERRTVRGVPGLCTRLGALQGKFGLLAYVWWQRRQAASSAATAILLLSEDGGTHL